MISNTVLSHRTIKVRDPRHLSQSFTDANCLGKRGCALYLHSKRKEITTYEIDLSPCRCQLITRKSPHMISSIHPSSRLSRIDSTGTDLPPTRELSTTDKLYKSPGPETDVGGVAHLLPQQGYSISPWPSPASQDPRVGYYGACGRGVLERARVTREGAGVCIPTEMTRAPA